MTANHRRTSVINAARADRCIREATCSETCSTTAAMPSGGVVNMRRSLVVKCLRFPRCFVISRSPVQSGRWLHIFSENKRLPRTFQPQNSPFELQLCQNCADHFTRPLLCQNSFVVCLRFSESFAFHLQLHL